MLLACACRGPESPSQPTVARVSITDVTVGLTQPDGSAWDGLSSPITAADTAALASALAAFDPVAAVASVLARPSVAAIDKPEVAGKAILFLRAAPEPPQKFHGQQDAMRPLLTPQPTWLHVPLDGTARIELDLVDEDVAFDDPIATLVVSSAGLDGAAAAGKVYQFKVADQTASSVLFVGLSVIPE